MNEFIDYQRAHEIAQRAYAEYNAASRGLDNARIFERLAEIKSQHEPLATLLTKPLSERDRLCAAAFYVAVGRMPSEVQP